MMVTYKNAFFFLYVFLATKSFAINIVSHTINGLMLKDASGPYASVLERVNYMGNTKYSLEVSSLKRALRNFKNKHNDCLLSGNSITLKNPSQYLISEPLSEIKLHFFNMKQHAPISNFDDLAQDKWVGGIQGIEGLYKKVLPRDIQLKLVASDEQNLNMLAANRTQAIVGFLPDLNPYLETLHYDEDFVLYQGSDNLICHDTKEVRRYLKQFNQALIELKASPDYHKIMP